MTRTPGQWWKSRSAPERKALAVLALILGLALYAWLLQTTTQARRQLRPAVAKLQAQSIRQAAQADEILRLRAVSPSPSSTTDLRTLVQRQVQADGLAASAVSVELVDAQHVKLVFGSVAFADWLRWADSMQVQHLRIAAVRIEAQAIPGQVSVTTTIERPGR